MIWTFFYGSWINFTLLKEKDLLPEKYEVAKLHGYDIYIQPIANLIPSESSVVYGVLLGFSREKHLKILVSLTQGAMGNIYLPEAVIVETLEGKLKAAICYMASPKQENEKIPKSEYIEPLIHSAKEWKFPDWYTKHLESFRPNS